MTRQSLSGAWQLRQAGSNEWLPAQVPGGVHTDLMAAGRIADPFVGDEELRVQWVAEADWEYRRTFRVDAEVAAEQRVALVFDGLDTLADVRLNGELLGSADNMFRTWRWDVTGRLAAGDNEVAVLFHSAVRRGAELNAVRALDRPKETLPGGPYLRKAPCHFGWDWGPKLPNVGIWQDVRIEGWSAARLADVRIEQTVEVEPARASLRSGSKSNGRTPPTPRPSRRAFGSSIRTVGSKPSGRHSRRGVGRQPLARDRRTRAVVAQRAGRPAALPGRSRAGRRRPDARRPHLPGRPADARASAPARPVGRVVHLRRQRRARLREGLQLDPGGLVPGPGHPERLEALWARRRPPTTT